MKISTCHTSQERLLGLELSHFFFFFYWRFRPLICLTICLRVRPGRHKPEYGRAGKHRRLILRADI